MYMYFPAFSLETKLFGIHQTSFLPVEALEFSELKTPLVYAFFPPKSDFGVPSYPDAGKNGTKSVIVIPLFACPQCQ